MILCWAAHHALMQSKSLCRWFYLRSLFGFAMYEIEMCTKFCAI